MVNIKPVITAYHVAQQGANWVIAINTQAPAYLSVLASAQAPSVIVRNKLERGAYQECGFWYEWQGEACTPQLEVGATYLHTFYISPGSPPVGLYFFFTDSCLNLDATWTSPMFYTGDWVGPPPPIPFAGGEQILQSAALVTVGSHYVWWANGAWYAVIPSFPKISVYKRYAGLWVIKDETGEPTPGADTFRGCASFLSSNGSTIHIIYHIKRGNGVSRPVYYAAFDTLTDTWGTFELIDQTSWLGPQQFVVAICNLASGIPAVVYMSPLTANARFVYSHRLPAGWISPEVIWNRGNGFAIPSAVAITPASGDFHVVMDPGGRTTYYRKRSTAGAWDILRTLPAGGDFLNQNCITIESGSLFIGRSTPTQNCSLVTGDPPLTAQNNIFTPAEFPKGLLSSPSAPASLFWVTRLIPSQQGYRYRNTAGVWQPRVHFSNTTSDVVSATLSPPNIAGIIISQGTLATCWIHTLEIPTS